MPSLELSGRGIFRGRKFRLAKFFKTSKQRPWLINKANLGPLIKTQVTLPTGLLITGSLKIKTTAQPGALFDRGTYFLLTFRANCLTKTTKLLSLTASPMLKIYGQDFAKVAQ